MKTMCPPGSHYNDFLVTHALGHINYVHLASVRLEHWVCRSWITYDHLYIIYIKLVN